MEYLAHALALAVSAVGASPRRVRVRRGDLCTPGRRGDRRGRALSVPARELGRAEREDLAHNRHGDDFGHDGETGHGARAGV